MRKFILSCCIAILACETPVLGQMIGESNFGPNAVVTNFDGLALDLDNQTPLTIDGHTFTTAAGILLYYGTGGDSNSAMSAGVVATEGDTDYIDVVFSEPVLRAGAAIGAGGGASWAASISFFDESDSLLGTVDLDGDSDVGQFAGWEAQSGLIARMRALDTAANGRILLMDNLRVESVPEPSSSVLVLGGLLILLRRKR